MLLYETLALDLIQFTLPLERGFALGEFVLLALKVKLVRGAPLIDRR